MPFKPVATPKCPKCDKAVYHAEQITYNNVQWHKTCFKCCKCNKTLETSTCNDHEGEVFCKPCYGKAFGPKGYGFGGGAGALSDTGKTA